MPNMRHANAQWVVANEDGNVTEWQQVIVAVLMDLRDRLDVTNRKLSALECPRFLGIPSTLNLIAVNTKKPTRKRKRRIAR